jgi:dTDP-4-dehydrorhamnose reductase
MSYIVVLGASGQLGQCLQSITAQTGLTNIHFASQAEANILDVDKLTGVFEKYKPAYIINCAAYTAVDKAEDDAEKAQQVNVTGVANISRLCNQFNTTLIHISTDFVFKGDASSPRNETSPVEPIGVYGKTKLDGEKAVQQLLTKYFIIRTGWLYSEFAGNFVKTMLKFGAERDELKIIADQVGTPTYAIDLATSILQIIENNSDAYGIYHYSNEGVTSWYDFAKAIFEISGTKVKVTPVRTDEYVTRAVRPPYSVLDKTKIKKQFALQIPYWRDSLAACINKLK